MQNEDVTLPSDELETEVETETTENTTDEAQNAESPPDEVDASEKNDRKESNRTQRRIERLLREKYEAKAKADYLEQVLASQQAQESAPANGKPQPQQYASTEEYIEALTDYKLAERDHASSTAKQRQQQTDYAQRTESLLSEAESLGDFDRDEFASNVRITPAMAEAILDSDMGAKIVLHLNSHSKEASRIAELSPARQAAEIGKLEAKLSAPVVKKSAAPKPIEPLSGTSNKPTGLDDSLSPEEWARVRNAQLYGKK